MLDAAARVVLTRGTSATIAEIAHEAGAPIGSAYHSREVLRAEVSAINDEVNAVSQELARRRYEAADAPRITLLHAATRQCPYGLVRPYLGGEIPDWVDEATAACARAIAALGD
ncbi:TetR family transcriptional regulator [Actinomyces respiraculi]|uniref:TetR family transcriptional regulator n=1 Tax=Actinomyces respiraculi TaxID=2744574 RepID=A0A7T0LN79_9ACTO|nr:MULTISPECIES: TetR family transcriptional regulator [Actinomyces]QPL06566.1 TetR family transcriptional regulator [Actinomyces respiraculi]